ncbi:hypothetical protein BCR39DRAFT_518418 [Naematelia encephala]|uniref:G-patch domain-containing protein n=1 Tax=Naematelia encephala TaxID=71784 RepID=A0A1Y2BH09_9TREE|nr:hypothetical protein BCR39DRAFT_518418 [Naematelia encephala]
MYSPPPGSRLQAPPTREAQPSAAASTGDDAYARRLALSQAATGNDAYARRAALASAATGDDAYARRAALAQASAAPPPPLATTPPSPPPPPMSAPPAPPPTFGLPTPPPPPSFAPPAFQTSSSSTPAQPSFVPPPAHLMAQAPPSFSPPPPHLVAAAPSGPPPASGIPGFGNYGQSAQPPAQIPTPPIATSSAPGASQDDFTKMLEERRKAAEAIAAKFKSLPGAPPPPMSEVQGATFAEKMLNRYGHKEGQGLGARGDGILHALTTEHVAPAPKDPSQPLSKRQLAKQKAAAANAKTRKWVQHSTTRGKIVNANEEAGERERDASRVVCLIGLVGNEEEVDEGLADEIGEECSRIGVVERVLLHMVEPPPPEPSECLRVFVVFSGLAGAWRATKELDGRFFGGRKIRAVYFDEAKFNAGDRDGPVE